MVAIARGLWNSLTFSWQMQNFSEQLNYQLHKLVLIIDSTLPSQSLKISLFLDFFQWLKFSLTWSEIPWLFPDLEDLFPLTIFCLWQPWFTSKMLPGTNFCQGNSLIWWKNKSGGIEREWEHAPSNKVKVSQDWILWKWIHYTLHWICYWFSTLCL